MQSLQQQIIETFQHALQKKSQIEQKVQLLDQISKFDYISNRVKNKIAQEQQFLSELFKVLSNESNLFYLFLLLKNTFDYYHTILNKPIIVSFLNCNKFSKFIQQQDSTLLLAESIAAFQQIYAYFSLNHFIPLNNTQNNIQSDSLLNQNTCLICNSNLIFKSNNAICTQNGHTFTNYGNTTHFNDTDKISMFNNHSYSRLTHFKEAILRFQGLEKDYIPPAVYNIIKKNCKNYNIDPITDKLTKSHVTSFLKSFGFTKYYDNINLIYNTLLGKQCHNIAYLEHKLVEDFKQFLQAYDNLNNFKNRRNFLNINFILYILLRKNKYPCELKDFNTIKTIEKRSYCFSIVQQIFDALNWRLIK